MIVLEILFGSSLFLLQHPFLTYPLSLRLLRRIRGNIPIRRVAEPSGISVDILCCAYNEEASIRGKIANCLDIMKADPAVTVRCYSDGSSDRTASILLEHAQQLDVVISDRRLGKSHGMNSLLSRSEAEIIVFTDANTTIDLKALNALRSYFADPGIGCVCGNLIYVNAADSATAEIGSLYWRLEQLIKKQETATGSTMGADGALFAIRRSLSTQIPADIIDDMLTSLSVLCKGYRIVQSDDVTAFERSVTRPGEEFRRKVRIACRAFNCHRCLWPRLRHLSTLNTYKYLSHKWLRWFAAVWMLLAFASFVALAALMGRLWIVEASLVIGGGLYAAGASGKSRMAASLTDIPVSFVATALGVWKSLRGERFQTWSVALSARNDAASADGVLLES